jgi:methyl-accepting chemotaxis protein
MHRLRNLPIAFKLALSQACALVLLAGLVAVVVQAIDLQHRFEARNAVAVNAQRDGMRAIAATREAQLFLREIRTAQSEEAVQQARIHAEMLIGRAGRMLNAMRDAAPEPGVREQTERAAKAVDDYLAAVPQAAALRVAELNARQALLPLGEAFNTANAAANTASLNLDAADASALEAALQSYRDAVRGTRETALVFLATGDAGLRSEIEALATTARQAAITARAVDLPSEMAAPINTLFAAGDTGTQAALALFDNAAKLKDFYDNEIEGGRRSVEGKLDAVVSAFSELAEGAREAAEAALARARVRVLGLAGGVALVLLLAGALTARSIARPIVAMTRAVQRMAAGETGVAIAQGGRGDEVGRIAAALETLRQAVARAYLQGQMLEQLPVAVMTAEATAEGRLTYLNAAARALFAPLAGHLAVPPEQLLGQGLEVFGAALAPARAALAEPGQLPQRLRLGFGAEVLELLISALRAPDGSYAGPMLSWQRLTRQERLAEQFEASVAAIAGGVDRAAAALAATAAQMRAAAADSTAQLGSAGAAAQAASGHVQAVAASAEELAAAVREIGAQVAESARLAGEAVAQAQATDRSVAALAEAAGRIGAVVGLIRDIAGRTNLLALNATIEAARAGEAGRGFAVVAGEVKTLATQTARATEEIAGQIAAMQGETGQAVAALRDIGGMIRRQSEIATAIAGAVEEQGAATAEIARSVQQVAAGTAALEAALAAVTATARATGAQAEDVVQASHALASQSTTLSTQAASFLHNLKAA